MSFILHGIGVSDGIAIGRAQLVSHATLEAAHYTIAPEQIDAEIERLTQAMRAVQLELETLRAEMDSDEAPAEFGAFLDVHWMILTDPTLAETSKRIIAEQRCNAEWALAQQTAVLVEQFDAIEDPYLRERKADVVQVAERVLKVLTGKPGPMRPLNAEEHTILVAHDLSPADIIQFKKHRFAAFLTDLGGVTSHTAIVARSLNVPAVVAAHNARALIQENELLIVDGAQQRRHRQSGPLGARRIPAEARRIRARAAEAAAPDHDASDDARRHAGRAAGQHRIARGSRARARRRRDGRRPVPQRIPVSQSHRTCRRRTSSSRRTARVAAGMEGKPVTMRTFDLGADKHKEGLDGLVRVAPNPALGLRAIRLCLAEPQLFVTQLRAILRASHYGNMRILIPMLVSARRSTRRSS